MRKDTCHVCCYVMVEEINMHENIMLEVNLTTLEWNVWFVMSVWFGDLGTGGGGGYSDLVPTGVCRWSRQTCTHL